MGISLDDLKNRARGGPEAAKLVRTIHPISTFTLSSSPDVRMKIAGQGSFNSVLLPGLPGSRPELYTVPVVQVPQSSVTTGDIPMAVQYVQFPEPVILSAGTEGSVLKDIKDSRGNRSVKVRFKNTLRPSLQDIKSRPRGEESEFMDLDFFTPEHLSALEIDPSSQKARIKSDLVHSIRYHNYGSPPFGRGEPFEYGREIREFQRQNKIPTHSVVKGAVDHAFDNTESFTITRIPRNVRLTDKLELRHNNSGAVFDVPTSRVVAEFCPRGYEDCADHNERHPMHKSNIERQASMTRDLGFDPSNQDSVDTATQGTGIMSRLAGAARSAAPGITGAVVGGALNTPTSVGGMADTGLSGGSVEFPELDDFIKGKKPGLLTRIARKLKGVVDSNESEDGLGSIAAWNISVIGDPYISNSVKGNPEYSSIVNRHSNLLRKQVGMLKNRDSNWSSLTYLESMRLFADSYKFAQGISQQLNENITEDVVHFLLNDPRIVELRNVRDELLDKED